MDELKEKMAKFAGFVWYDEPCSQEGCSAHCGWRYPNGDTVYPLGMSGLLNFPESLDACDKWLMPKLFAFSLHTHWNSCDEVSTFIQADVYKDRRRSFVAKAETASLAFCLAIEKLIDGGK